MTEKEIFKIKKKVNQARLEVNRVLEELQDYIGIFKDEPEAPQAPQKDDEPPF